MKILIITEVFYPVVGGAGKFVYNAAASLTKRGHKVYILTRSHKNRPLRENLEAIEVCRLAWSNNLFFQPFIFCNIKRFINRFLKENSLDLIICNQPFSAFGAYFAKRSRIIPKIYNFHSSWFMEFKVKKGIQDLKLNSLSSILRFIMYSPVAFFMRKIESFVVHNYDTIVVASQYSKDMLISFYCVDENRIKMIPGFVDIEKFKPAQNKLDIRKVLDLPQDKYILMTARNLVERMGIDNLILAFNILSKKYEYLYLLICGTGRLKNKLMKLSYNLNLSDKIKFTGELQESELVKCFQASDLFILPTKYIEHFGLVTVEAMAAGIPVLGTPVGGTVEILNKFNKDFVFKGTDADSLVDGIKQFLENYKNIDLKDKCREFAIRGYSLDKIMDEAEKLCLDIIKNAKTKG